MHKALLRLLLLIEKQDIKYKELWICDAGKIIKRGLPLKDYDLSQLETKHSEGFDLAIICEEPEVMAFDLYEVTYRPEDDRLAPPYNDYYISYIYVRP